MIAPRQPIGLKPSAPEPGPRDAPGQGGWSGDGDGDGDGEGASAAAPAGRLAAVSTELLRRELERRQRGVAALFERRDSLRQEIARLDAAIAELADETPRRERGRRDGGRKAARLALPRPRNTLSLSDAIAAEVEAGQTVSPTDAARRVLASGYRTTARKFTMVVANALSKDKRFKRLARGKYERIH
ncbi:MAG TPA: hypothetical protein VFD43_10085 [Planctomycetota bacterium]|nr:hypothetical protein [Planctomycetota bacterium]